MEQSQQFQNPEEEIKYLEGRILEKKKEIEARSSREIVSDTIREHTALAVPPAPPAPPAVPVPPPPPPLDLERDIAPYVEMAFSRGISEAVAEVRKTHNPHLIDAFHDALADRFHGQMKAKGLLGE